MVINYSFDELPVEYNTWILFRQVVDIILINDFLSYCIFAFTVFRVPDGLSLSSHALRWLVGFDLILFNLWVKTEAHHIVKDYGWYWGDDFFERGRLVPSPSPDSSGTVFDTSLGFDGVFEMAAHPVYSVGYAGYYGLSLIAGSYALFFVSLWAHAMQFGFLVWFDNPSKLGPANLSTPVHTDAKTETKAEVEAEPNTLSPASPSRSVTVHTLHIRTDSDSLIRVDNDSEAERVKSHRPRHSRNKSTSKHDLFAHYFRKDVVGLKNINLLRASDLKLDLLTLYIVLPSILLNTTATYLLHALAWRVFHSFVLGGILRAQSKGKRLVRHFVECHLPCWLGKPIHHLSSGPPVISFSDTLGVLSYTGIYQFLNNPERTMSGATIFGLALTSTSHAVFSVAVASVGVHWWFLSFVERLHMKKLYGDSIRKEAGLTKD
ncbi:phosphatidylethanolamine N-methyltransferase [Rhizoctonia solani]